LISCRRTSEFVLKQLGFFVQRIAFERMTH
jgi:hypothetical protein